MTFQDLGLEPMLLKAVTEMGFENPTTIQEKTIPQLKDKLSENQIKRIKLMINGTP